MTLAMRDQQTQGWMASVVFHAMLFLLLGVSFEDRTESFAEMLFLETGPPPASGPVEDALGRPLSTAPLPPESATLVDLPRRDATDLPPEEILPVPARRETAVAERQPASVVDRLTRTGLERPPADVGLQQGNKVAPPTGNPAGDIPPIEGAAASGAGSRSPLPDPVAGFPERDRTQHPPRGAGWGGARYGAQVPVRRDPGGRGDRHSATAER